MKITIGPPATKANFFPRNVEVQRIYRSLDDGNNIYLSAPRRVGKTSIMQHLQEKPKSGYVFVYGDYEVCKSTNDFLKCLLTSLKESSAQFKKGSRVFNKISETINQYLESLSIEISGVKLEAKLKSEIDWIEKLKRLFKELQDESKRLVIMIDEFPQVVLNILSNEDENAAANFLLLHRQLRNEIRLGNHKISFIYTGSISLQHAVLKAADLKAVNDFDFIYVDPLIRPQAKAMIELILKEYQLSLTEAQTEELMDRIEWLVPYHIQLVLKEIREISQEETDLDSEKIIDRAFENLLHLQNKPQFDHYFSRLQKVFQREELDFVFKALELAASQTGPTFPKFVDIATACGCLPRCAEILETLEIDGYLAQNHRESTYHFRSPILKAWWKRHESKKHQ
jgi:uncharacterized protein